MLNLVEENYLKGIYHQSFAGKNPVTTNALADNMNNEAASVTDKIQDVKQGIVFLHQRKERNSTVRAIRLPYLSSVPQQNWRAHRCLSILEKVDFDGSLEVVIDNSKRVFISRQASENLLIAEQNEM